MEMRETHDVGEQKKQKSEKTEEVRENSIDFHVIAENELETQNALQAADTVLLQRGRP